ncbi:hypothetical protein C8R45DRAFT_1217420 [Mycena sanguinolenta]|nr:hypothetical protein C8R45DRAFT_1217420 [Mycena sanguinolenta]
MPFLFSRARTASTPSKSKHKPPPPPPALSYPYPSSTPQPGTPIGEFDGQAQAAGEGGYGAVGFLPTTLPVDINVPWASTSTSTSSPHSSGLPPSATASAANLALFGSDSNTTASASSGRPAYGLLSSARDTVLGLPDVARLVAVLCAELERTGVSTPFVFSSLALDVRRTGVSRLIRAFLVTCSGNSNHAYRNGAGSDKFADEARLAAAHELGMCLRWGLSRVVRVETGREVRGLLSWAWYERWRVEERANAYPPTVFSTFLTSLPAELPPILAPLFAVCNTHSGSSEHTPPSLASIFGPVSFGLSPVYLAPVPMSPGGKKRSEELEEVLFPTIDDFGGFAGVYEAGKGERVHCEAGCPSGEAGVWRAMRNYSKLFVSVPR